MATTASVYNASRTTRQVLKRHRKEGPSLTLHLHTTTFRFERQNGAFLCESPLKNLLYFIRDQKVPADLVDIFDEARVPFFEGCLIVEVHDHRSSLNPHSSSSHSQRQINETSPPTDSDDALISFINPESSAKALGGNYGFEARLGINGRSKNGDQIGSPSPSVYRVVLYPSAETLWSDLRTLNEIEGAGLWTDDDVLEIESRILTLTSPPLCLTPDLQASRIANIMLSATALPSAYTPGPIAPLPYFRQSDRKRGINSIEVELDEANKKRREKIMKMMQRGSATKGKEMLVGSTTLAPSFSRMSFVERWRMMKANNEANAGKLVEGGGLGDTISMSMDDKIALSGSASAPKKKSKKKKAAAAGTAEEEASISQLPQELKESTPPATTPAKKKTKKKAQREKEEKEKAEKEQAEREAAAAAAAAAAKMKEEETPKKGKKKTKKEREAEAAAAATATAANTTTPTASNAGSTTTSTKKQTAKKASKAKKVKVEPSPSMTNASLSMDSTQTSGNLGMGQTPIMYPQQLPGGYLMNSQNLTQGAMNGSPSMPTSFGGQFGNNQVLNTQQQQIQQAAIQRVLHAQQIQHQQQQQQQQGQMNTNFMMSAPQIQQHFQALMQQQQMRQQQQQHQQQQQSQQQINNGLTMDSNQQQGQFGGDSLPVGVGLGNLPPNWNGMG